MNTNRLPTRLMYRLAVAVLIVTSRLSEMAFASVEAFSSSVTTIPLADAVSGTYDAEGQLHGLATLWYPNGQTAVSGFWDHGVKDGMWTYWSEGGATLAQGGFRDGRPDGKWVAWDANGRVESEGRYWNGVKSGYWTYYWTDSGRPKAEGAFAVGAMDGLWTFWDWDGTRSAEALYRKGNLVCEKEFDSDGQTWLSWFADVIFG